MCGSDGLSLSSSLLICGKSCRCQAENPLNALPSFTRPALASAAWPTFEEYWADQLSETTARIWIQATQRNIDSKKLGQYINDLYWRVIEIHGSFTLMTCDRPIVMTNGLDRPDGHLALPISPEKLFVAANNPQAVQ